jgi:hypothetical protein
MEQRFHSPLIRIAQLASAGRDPNAGRLVIAEDPDPRIAKGVLDEEAPPYVELVASRKRPAPQGVVYEGRPKGGGHPIQITLVGDASGHDAVFVTRLTHDLGVYAWPFACVANSRVRPTPGLMDGELDSQDG